MNVFDLIVIGGGPSGMIAAGRAGERGLSVLLLEKNLSLGEKLKISGGGRCNITNAEPDIHKFLSYYGDAKPSDEGGVAVDEVDMRTMRSQKIANLFL